jgi:hypothetical protein
MKPLHTLNPLHAGAEALAAVGKTEGVRKTTGVSPTVGRPLTNEPINLPDPEVPEKKHAENSLPLINCACCTKPKSVSSPAKLGPYCAERDCIPHT